MLLEYKPSGDGLATFGKQSEVAGELAAGAVGQEGSDLRWGSRPELIALSFVTKSKEFGFSLRCNREACESTWERRDRTSFLFNKVFWTTSRKGCRKPVTKIGKPIKNTCQEVRRRRRMAWARVEREDAGEMGCFPESR